MDRESWRRDCANKLVIETHRRVGKYINWKKKPGKDRRELEGVFGLVNGSKNQHTFNWEVMEEIVGIVITSHHIYCAPKEYLCLHFYTFHIHLINTTKQSTIVRQQA